MRQLTLATGAGLENHMRPTHKVNFLAYMENLIPGSEFFPLIKPLHHKAGSIARQ
jgi:hypothetical protein